MTEKRPNHRPPKERTLDGEKLNDEFYTTQETADLLKLHYNTVRRMIRNGELKAEKAGCQWRISKAELERFAKPM